MARAADAGHAAALAEELRRFQLANGSWAGTLAATAESLFILHALVVHPDEAVVSCVDRAAEWIGSRQDVPGCFAEGCDPARHESGVCEHALTGFFSPGAPGEDLSGFTVGVPARFGTDADARLGLSCVALQALLRWRRRDSRIERHITSLRQLVAGPGLKSVTERTVGGYVAAVAALLEAGDEEHNGAAASAGLKRMIGLQRADGSWPGGDIFHVLDLLLSASARGYGELGTEPAITRAVEMLALLQRADGSWGKETGPERMLVAWRALRYSLSAGSAE